MARSKWREKIIWGRFGGRASWRVMRWAEGICPLLQAKWGGFCETTQQVWCVPGSGGWAVSWGLTPSRGPQHEREGTPLSGSEAGTGERELTSSSCAPAQGITSVCVCVFMEWEQVQNTVHGLGWIHVLYNWGCSRRVQLGHQVHLGADLVKIIELTRFASWAQRERSYSATVPAK